MMCSICGHRPVHEDGKRKGVCPQCTVRIDTDKARNKPDVPVKFITYRGNVVGLFPSGPGTYQPRMVNRAPESLPKDKTINLDKWCPGFDKDQIKKFKRAVLSACGC